MKFSRTIAVLGTAALLLAGGAIAQAAIPSADGSVKVCYAKTGSLAAAKGTARVVDAGEACKSTETSVTLPSADALAGLKATVSAQAADLTAAKAANTDQSAQLDVLRNYLAGKTTFTMTDNGYLYDGRYCAVHASATNALPGTYPRIVADQTGQGADSYKFLSIGPDGTLTGNQGFALVDKNTTFALRTIDGPITAKVCQY